MPGPPSIFLLPEAAVVDPSANGSQNLEFSPIEEIQPEEIELILEEKPKLDINFEILEKILQNAEIQGIPTKEEKSIYNFSMSNSNRIMVHSQALGAKYIDSLTDLDIDEWKLLLDNGTFWIDLIGSNPTELKLLKEIFQIHHLTIDSIYIGCNKDKLESFKNYHYLSYQSAKASISKDKGILDTDIDTISLNNIITVNGIITISSEPLYRRERILKRLRALEIKNFNSPGWIAYALLDEAIDSIDPLLKACETETERLEDIILDPSTDTSKAFTSKTIHQLGTLKHHLFSLTQLLTHKLDLCQNLTRKVISIRDFDSGIQLYFGDVEDHITSMIQNCYHLEKVLNTTHCNYVDSLTLRYIQENNESFDKSMFFTYAGASLSIFLLTTGIWGMNINVLGQTNDDQEEQNNLNWFIGILVISLLISLIVGSISHWYAKSKLKRK